MISLLYDLHPPCFLIDTPPTRKKILSLPTVIHFFGAVFVNSALKYGLFEMIYTHQK